MALLPHSRLPTPPHDVPPLRHRRPIPISPTRLLNPASLPRLPKDALTTQYDRPHRPSHPLPHLPQRSPLHLPSPPNPTHPCRLLLYKVLPPHDPALTTIKLPFPTTSASSPHRPLPFLPRSQHPHHDSAPNSPTLSPHIPPYPIHNTLPLPTTLSIIPSACPKHHDRRLPNALSQHALA